MQQRRGYTEGELCRGGVFGHWRRLGYWAYNYCSRQLKPLYRCGDSAGAHPSTRRPCQPRPDHSSSITPIATPSTPDVISSSTAVRIPAAT